MVSILAKLKWKTEHFLPWNNVSEKNACCVGGGLFSLKSQNSINCFIRDPLKNHQLSPPGVNRNVQPSIYAHIDTYQSEKEAEGRKKELQSFLNPWNYVICTLQL